MKNQPITQVILVDDDPDYVYLVERALQECAPASSLTVFANGSDLLERLANYPINPSLILLDINMPVVNGFEVLHVLRSVDRYKKIPVVMLSVSQRREDVTESYAIGANAYLVKPTGFMELKRRLAFFHPYWFAINKTSGAN